MRVSRNTSAPVGAEKGEAVDGEGCVEGIAGRVMVGSLGCGEDLFPARFTEATQPT